MAYAYLLSNRSDTISNERKVAKNRISTIDDIPTQKKLKTDQSPERNDNKISCRPFQYLSMVKDKSPGATVIIKGKWVEFPNLGIEPPSWIYN